MKELIDETISYIEKASYAVLITIGEENKPSVREIGPLINIGTDIYFVTRNDSQKVKHFNVNPCVTVYFPNTNPDPKGFKSIAVTGTITCVTDKTEINYFLDELDRKSPYFKNHISKDGFDIWGIYRLTSKTLQITDYARPERKITTELKQNRV